MGVTLKKKAGLGTGKSRFSYATYNLGRNLDKSETNIKVPTYLTHRVDEGLFPI